MFVHDHVELLKNMGHEVRVVNPLPRMPRFAEARRSTMVGVSKAPKRWNFEGGDVQCPRFFGLPDHPYPSVTAWSIKRRAASVEQHLGSWRPDAIVCHTLWPVGVLANALAKRWAVPWVGVVHGHDFDVGLNTHLNKHIAGLAASCSKLVCVTPRLANIAEGLPQPPQDLTILPCHTHVGKDWARPMKPWRGRWRKSSIDLLFPADPRRPEKRHLLALQAGEVLEQRGWVVGVTTLRHQPRDVVFDRMMVADVTVVTSSREAGPLVAREALLCGTPVVSVDVGEVATYLPSSWVVEPTPEALADGVERALHDGWPFEETPQDVLAFASVDTVKHAWTEVLEALRE